MRNWDVFIIVSTAIITLALFASDKVSVYHIFDNINLTEALIVMFKTITIAIAGTLIIALMVFVVLSDIIISLLLKSEFPLIQYFYNTIYMEYFRGWYWDAHNGNHILFACIVLFGMGIINTYLGPMYRSKTLVYSKTNSKNYIKH